MTSSKKTFAEIKNKKKPVTKTVLIVLDPEIGSKFLEAKELYETAKADLELAPKADNRKERSALSKAKEAFDEAKAEAEENSAEFVLRALSRNGMDEIVAKHPPTSKQKKEAEEKGDEASWNGDTFPPAFIAACCVSPELSEEEAQEMWDSPDWNQAELMSLFMAALEVQQTRKVLDLKKD